jgi:mRNA-degrading endonuclease RelE of RelBE toxin-antitoxin system
MATNTTDSQPAYTIRVHHTADTELQQVPDQTHAQLKTTLREVAQTEQPTTHKDVRPMRNADNLFRIRQGKYRALCDLNKPYLRVLLVGHRDGLYDRTQEALDRR